jgi:hypothetical protein
MSGDNGGAAETKPITDTERLDWMFKATTIRELDERAEALNDHYYDDVDYRRLIDAAMLTERARRTEK